MGRLVFLRVIAIVLAGLFVCPASGAPVWFEAEAFARSNWPGGRSGEGWFAPTNDTEAAKLSGGIWLNTGRARRSLFAEYDIAVPTGGTYKLFARRFWRHGPFRWRFDDGPWHTVGHDTPLLDSVPIKTDTVANWIALGAVDLDEGSHTLRIELTADKGAAAFDCFLLTDEPFTPRGKLTPGEKLDLAGEGTWAFEPRHDRFSDESLLDLRYLNEDVAGQNGRVTSRGGQFLLGDGRPVRFWGTNIGNHRHDLQTLRHQARRLAKLGVNQVRFHESLQPKGEASKLTDVNDTYIDGCHKLVAAMRDEGIYTLISPFFVLNMQVRPSWKIPGYDAGGEKPFGLLFWDERLQTGYKAWVRELLTRPNPYTGIPLAKDPAVNVFQLQNEDSLFFWTFMSGVAKESQTDLGQRFGRWLTAKYGSLPKALTAWGGAQCRLKEQDKMIGDDFAAGVAGFLGAWSMTSKQYGRMDKRVADQIEFLAHIQRQFNTEMARYLREDLGYTGLIAANVWRAADPVSLQDVERYTYLAGDVIDKHYYFGIDHVNPIRAGRARYMVSEGDLFISESALHNPRRLPTHYKQVVARPHIITECTWPQPNRFKAEAPLLVAAYASLTDLDGFFWFASGSPDYDRSMRKFQVNIPSIMGQFPGAALLYRKGYVKTAEVVAREDRTLADMWARKFPIIAEDSGYDPNRDMNRPAAAPATTVDPLAFLVGRVEVRYGARQPSHKTANLARHIDRAGQAVTSVTGELNLQFGPGLLTINAPKAQGAAGFFTKAGAVDLADVRIESKNDYGSLLVVPLDDQPIAESRRILIQSATEENLYEFETAAATITTGKGKTKRSKPARRIVNQGRPPWNVVETDASVSIRNRHLRKATALDADGYPTGAADSCSRDGDRFIIRLPEDAMYTIVE